GCGGAPGLVGEYLYPGLGYVSATGGRLCRGHRRLWRRLGRHVHRDLRRLGLASKRKLHADVHHRWFRIRDRFADHPRAGAEAGASRYRYDGDHMSKGSSGKPLTVPPKAGARWDLIALGEVMLRFDPGDRRIWTARTFEVSEGGGEYNVARGLRRCFGLDTAIVTAIADNPIGRLLEDLLNQGGVDQSLVRWVEYDGVGRTVRNGLNFTERGFGLRAPLGCSDRGHTAVSQLKAGDIDWDEIFGTRR